MGCLRMLGVNDNAQMSGHNKCPVGWARYSPVGNTAIKTYLEKVPVTSTDSYRTFFSIYLWLHSITA